MDAAATSIRLGSQDEAFLQRAAVHGLALQVDQSAAVHVPRVLDALELAPLCPAFMKFIEVVLPAQEEAGGDDAAAEGCG